MELLVVRRTYTLSKICMYLPCEAINFRHDTFYRGISPVTDSWTRRCRYSLPFYYLTRLARPLDKRYKIIDGINDKVL